MSHQSWSQEVVDETWGDPKTRKVWVDGHHIMFYRDQRVVEAREFLNHALYLKGDRLSPKATMEDAYSYTEDHPNLTLLVEEVKTKHRFLIENGSKKEI